jgi:hypothetical protein
VTQRRSGEGDGQQGDAGSGTAKLATGVIALQLRYFRAVPAARKKRGGFAAQDTFVPPPDEAYERVKRYCDGPYIELFARASRLDRDGRRGATNEPSSIRRPDDIRYPRQDHRGNGIAGAAIQDAAIVTPARSTPQAGVTI